MSFGNRARGTVDHLCFLSLAEKSGWGLKKVPLPDDLDGEGACFYDGVDLYELSVCGDFAECGLSGQAPHVPVSGHPLANPTP